MFAHSAGYFPIAVSAARTSPSAPSRSVVIMSLTSDLNGFFVLTMDSKKFVATKTFFFILLALLIISFCNRGILIMGSSLDRSPRSMIIPSETLIMSFK